MKTHSTIKTLLIALFALPLLWSCGEVGSNGINCADNPGSPYCNAQFPTQYNFRITATSPYNETNLVSTQLEIIRIYFSEPVAEETIPGNILIFEETGGVSNDITNKFDFAANANTGQLEITIQENANYSLKVNTQYEIQFMPYLLSTVQNPIFGGLSGAYPDGSNIFFSTGASGGNSKAGPPSIISMDNFNSGQGCGAVLITFDEDIAYPPTAHAKIKRAFGLMEDTMPTNVYQATANRFDQWIAAIPTYACTQTVYTQGTITVTHAADFEGNQITSSKSKFIHIY